MQRYGDALFNVIIVYISNSKPAIQRVQGHLLTFHIRRLCCYSNESCTPLLTRPIVYNKNVAWDRLTHANGQYTFWLAMPSVLSHCWMGGRKSIRPEKVMRCWRSYMSGARCKWLAYGLADAAATPSSLLQKNPEYFDPAGTELTCCCCCLLRLMRNVLIWNWTWQSMIADFIHSAQFAASVYSDRSQMHILVNT